MVDQHVLGSNAIAQVRLALLETVVMMVIVGMAAGLVLLDVLILDDRLGEWSLTEVAQEVVLLITAMLFWIAARRPGCFGFGMLVGGFFGCMFVRELDAVFDVIRHGAWKVPAVLLAGVSIVMAWRDRAEAWPRIVEFIALRSFALMMAGLAILLVFSRLFGVPLLWRHVLSAADTEFVKRATEESVELLGYCLCLVASADWFLSTRPPGSSVIRPAT